MKIIFSDHANQQNLRRKIPKKYILETIKNPENNIRSFRARRLRQRTYGGKILEVVIKEENETITVITQYWLKEK